MSKELMLFVRQALEKGLTREEVHSKLVEARWPEDAVKSALDGFADIDFPIPIPRPRPYLSAKEAFVYLVLFSTLYTSAVSLIQLLFEFVHRGFPDPAASITYTAHPLGAVRWSTATLVIAFPVFLWLSRVTYRAIRRDPEKRTSKIRKWLTYMTLFVAAGVLLGDLITLVFHLLGGELTTRFILKVLVVGGVAGSVFGYYLWDLGQDDVEQGPSEKNLGLRVFAGLVILGVCACLLGGFVVAGSPGRARLMRLDDQRERDLKNIASTIDSLWEEEVGLPEDLLAFSADRGALLRSIYDPATGKTYEYRVTGEKTYELCATFDREDERPTWIRPHERFWTHGPGRTCFQVKVREAD